MSGEVFKACLLLGLLGIFEFLKERSILDSDLYLLDKQTIKETELFFASPLIIWTFNEFFDIQGRDLSDTLDGFVTGLRRLDELANQGFNQILTKDEV